MKVFELLEGAMPSSVIKHKEAMAQKTPEQMHKDFKEVSSRTGKSVKDLALSAARRHGHGDGSTKYWDKIKHLEEDACRVCGQTPCNCTHIMESQDFANMSTTELKRYVDRHVKNGIAHELSKDAKAKLKAAQAELNQREKMPTNEGYAPQGGNYRTGSYHVVVGGRSISKHPNRSSASSAAAAYRKEKPSSQPRVIHDDDVNGPSAAERKKSRDAQRSSAAKKAREAERQKGV